MSPRDYLFIALTLCIGTITTMIIWNLFLPKPDIIEFIKNNNIVLSILVASIILFCLLLSGVIPTRYNSIWRKKRKYPKKNKMS